MNPAAKEALLAPRGSASPNLQTAHGLRWWFIVLRTFGPGLVVMLADTDFGSLITAAQSGAQKSYTLLSSQIILIPILYLVQELTVRLGIVTQRGHGELIKDTFGRGWAWLSVSTLVISCLGAMVAEMSGVAGVGQIYGLPAWLSLLAFGLFLIVVVVTGSYRAVERWSLLLGAFELVFVVAAFVARPSLTEMGGGLLTFPVGDSEFWMYMSANIGAVIMPWMVFYQQSAVVDKGLQLGDLKVARIDTAVGAVVTQVIMSCTLVTYAAARRSYGASGTIRHLSSTADLVEVAEKVMGKTAGMLCCIGLLGASLVAAIVVSLAAAWGLGEVAGFRRSIEHTPQEAPWFYVVYVLMVVVGSAVNLLEIDVVTLNVWINVMNALLLPIVLGFLVALARWSLPDEHRIKGLRFGITVGLTALCSLFGLCAGVVGMFDPSSS